METSLLKYAEQASLVDGSTGSDNAGAAYGDVAQYGNVALYGTTQTEQNFEQVEEVDREQLLLDAIAAMGAFEPVKILPDQIAELQTTLNSMNSKLDLVVTQLDNIDFSDAKVISAKDTYATQTAKKTTSIIQWLKGLFIG